MPNPIPLSLYIHLPWCVKKCPYCDFNSHSLNTDLPETQYCAALLKDFQQQSSLIKGRRIQSIFFGGGTPSLFSPAAIAELLQGIDRIHPFDAEIEITLEANPGTIDSVHFKDYKTAGINRLSLGVQSFQEDKLKSLGRIHGKSEALSAIETLKAAGFSNFNIDLMYGLPAQTLEDAMFDIETALASNPAHLSWYQLTLEPNTLFYKQPPPLPAEDKIWEMQLAGMDVIKQQGFEHYEVSAYSLPGKACVHNTNYWEFGDYLGMGAGAHSKLTKIECAEVVRFFQVKHPKDYLSPQQNFRPDQQILRAEDLKFEFMLNALRLSAGIPIALFEERTGLTQQALEPELSRAQERGLLHCTSDTIKPTERGFRFLNDLMMMFL